MEKILNVVINPTDESPAEIIARQEESIHKLTSVINELPGSIYWKDANGTYLGHNHYSAEKMKAAGLTWQSIIGKTDFDLFSEEVASRYRQFDLEVMETGEESIQEEKVTLPTGETLIQLSYKRPLRNTQGKIIGVIGNTIDITHLKKIEMELRDAKDRAERANQSKTELLRHMEHDIRTPFNGIWILSSLLASQETNAEKKLCLEDISKSAKQLLDYCNNILYFARAETEIIPFVPQPFNIKNLIENVIAMENVAAKIKGLELLFEFSDNFPEIIISNSNHIQKILLNLVSNAIKFTHAGYIKISLILDKKIDEKTATISLIVEDTGIGIPIEKQTYLYRYDKKFDPHPTSGYAHGLGLPTVKLLLEELKGTINLTSETGKGTKFICQWSVTIPLLESE